MDAGGSAHKRPFATAVPPIMPPVRRIAGAAARHPVPTPVGSGGGGAAATAAAEATAIAAEAPANATDDAAADEPLAIAADGISAEGGCNDHGRPKLLPPPPTRWTKKVLPGGRLPPIQALFPAKGAASLGRVKRVRALWDAEEGADKTERAGVAHYIGSPADGRATKRRARDTWGGSTDGGSGGVPDAAGVASCVSLPTHATQSPVTDGGGSAAAAAAAMSTGATIPGGRRMVSASKGAPASPPAAASTVSPSAAASVSLPTVGQRLQYWSTVLAETSGAQDVGSGGGHGEGSSPVEMSSPSAGGDAWAGCAISGSPHGGSAGQVGATALAGEPWRTPFMVGGDEARQGAVGAGGGGDGGVGRSSGGGHGVGVCRGRGGTGGFERSFDLKTRILDRSAAGGGFGDLPRLSMPFYAPSGGGFPTGCRHTAPLPAAATLQMSGSGNGVTAAAVAPIGFDIRGYGAAARSPSGSAQALSGGCFTLSSAASIGPHVRREGQELVGVAARADGGDSIVTPRAATFYGAVGAAPNLGAPAMAGAVTTEATMTVPAVVGSEVHPGSAATHEADASVITDATAAAISARRLRRLAPAPSPYRHQQHPVTAGPPPGHRAALEAYANERPYACTICPIAFKRRYDLQQHHLAVHEKRRPFACPVCGAAFSHAGTRSKHVRTVHEKVKPFPCDSCDMRFSERGNLSKHRQRLHG